MTKCWALLFSIACMGALCIVSSFRVPTTSSSCFERRVCTASFHDVSTKPTLRNTSRLRATPEDGVKYPTTIIIDETRAIIEDGVKYPTTTIIIDETPEIYRDAIRRTLLWVGLAGAFGLGLGGIFGVKTSEEFFAGYLVEQSLSVDNLFVFLLLFEYFRVPLSSQDRVLNWGIYGAIVMRAVMIGVGAAALKQYHAILLLFAGILIYSSVKALIPGDEDDEDEDVSENAIVKFSRGLIDSTDDFDGSNFFTIVDGVKKATPLFICMIALEISDVVFAVDSIPAVFGVTEVRYLYHFYLALFICGHFISITQNLMFINQNPLIVFSSNMFAIMGLRSLYTILSKAATDLKYLEPAVGIVLGFIGSKMVAEYFGVRVPTSAALGVVAFFLSGGVGLSVLEKRREDNEAKEAS